MAEIQPLAPYEAFGLLLAGALLGWCSTVITFINGIGDSLRIRTRDSGRS
jgi:hypothetical protein